MSQILALSDWECYTNVFIGCIGPVYRFLGADGARLGQSDRSARSIAAKPIDRRQEMGKPEGRRFGAGLRVVPGWSDPSKGFPVDPANAAAPWMQARHSASSRHETRDDPGRMTWPSPWRASPDPGRPRTPGHDGREREKEKEKAPVGALQHRPGAGRRQPLGACLSRRSGRERQR